MAIYQILPLGSKSSIFDQIWSIYLIRRFHFYLKYKEKRSALDLPCKECHPPTSPTIHPMSIKGISMFLYRKQIFVILPFHFSWLNWVWKCCSISANFCIVYSCSTFRPSDHAYCQLYQFAYISSVLTFSFNGIKQIQQLYQFLHIQFHWFHHFN